MGMFVESTENTEISAAVSLLQILNACLYIVGVILQEPLKMEHPHEPGVAGIGRT